MKTKIMMAVALAGLSACGGGTTIEPPTTRSAPAFNDAFVSTTAPNTLTVAYSAATDQFTFAADGAALNGLVARPAQDNGAILGFQDANDRQFGYAFRSSGGQVAVVGSDSSTLNYRAARLQRFPTTTVPLSGAATYVGVYAGIVGNPAPQGTSNDVQFLMNGESSISVSFANNTVNGAITNRTLRSEGNTDTGRSIADVTLNPTTLNGAIRFSGTASGGGISGGTTSNGNYRGALTGQFGNELLGVMRIDHTTTAGTGNLGEIGIIVSTNQP